MRPCAIGIPVAKLLRAEGRERAPVRRALMAPRVATIEVSIVEGQNTKTGSLAEGDGHQDFRG